MATVQAPVTLDLQPTHEEQMLAEAVRGIASGSGPSTSRRAGWGRAADRAVGRAPPSRGYLGVNLPEELGGGGLGMSGLFAVGEARRERAARCS